VAREDTGEAFAAWSAVRPSLTEITVSGLHTRLASNRTAFDERR
jgi:hypothetical protein